MRPGRLPDHGAVEWAICGGIAYNRGMVAELRRLILICALCGSLVLLSACNARGADATPTNAEVTAAATSAATVATTDSVAESASPAQVSTGGPNTAPAAATAAPTRTPADTVRFAPPVCAGAPPTRLILYERGRVTENGRGLNLRRQPGTQSIQLAMLEPGDVFLVLAGPQCTDNYAWYFVRGENDGGNFEGWIAEGDLSEYYTEQYLPG